MKTFFTLFCLCLVANAAVIPYTALDQSQFTTNGQMVNYRSDWTNELGVIRPATVNTEVTVTNLNIYETMVLPAKVVLLTLGTNELNVATNSTWLLHSPTNDATQVILSLAAGKFQGQLLFLTSQNGDGAFTLPDESEQYDVPGALVDLQGDWVGTTNRGVILQYTAPDWIEMARFNPASTNGPFPPSGGDSIFVNTGGIVEPAGGQTATNRFSFTSGAADNATNVAMVVDSANEWTTGAFAHFRNHGTNHITLNPFGFATFGLGLGDGTAGQPTAQIQLSPDIASGVASLSVTAGIVTGDTNFNTINLYADSTTVAISAFDGGSKTYFNFFPTVASDGSAIAYLMDTSSVLTNGDSLFQVLNAGVNRVRVQHDGTLSIQATTNRIGDNGSAITYNGIVIGGSSSVITYTNQFVYNSKVTYNADVYVTNSSTIYISGVDVRSVAYGMAASDEVTALAVGTNKVRWRAPHAMTLTGVRASLTTAQTAGSLLTVDINKNGVTMLSTKLSIDQDETTSVTAATPAVISVSSLADDDIISVDLDQVGTSPAGLKITLLGLRLP